jgi:hypothetical protein
MKNCPWFSLRSNSIESRFRSIRRGNFLVNTFVTLRKSKSSSEFASLMSFFTRYAKFRKQTWKVRTHSGCSAMQVIDG